MAGFHGSSDIQVKDVYDFAFEIAEEFNKIIHLIDTEEVTPLINKIINVLELLEENVGKIENLGRENAELRAKNSKISCEKVANEEEKLSLKQAFEELEESWYLESETMTALVKKLKADNQLLQHNLSERKEAGIEPNDTYTTVIEEQNNYILKLNHHLKQKDSQIEKDQKKIESLSYKVEHLVELNKSLHHQYLEAKDKVTVSLIEKSKCETTINLQQREIHCLESSVDTFKKILDEEKECPTAVECLNHDKEHNLYEDSLMRLLEEQQKLKENVSELQRELALVKSQTEEYKRLLKVTSRKHRISQGQGHIQQIFRLFLGVFNAGTRICWFR